MVWLYLCRNLLCNLVRVKLGCYEREGQNSLSAEDYLKAFMETEVKPLWPKGWMQARCVLVCVCALDAIIYIRLLQVNFTGLFSG